MANKSCQHQLIVLIPFILTQTQSKTCNGIYVNQKPNFSIVIFNNKIFCILSGAQKAFSIAVHCSIVIIRSNINDAIKLLTFIFVFRSPIHERRYIITFCTIISMILDMITQSEHLFLIFNLILYCGSVAVTMVHSFPFIRFV